ncbi:MAG: hypothetical protein AAFY26_22525 [Cyanobacteria bacterium J06638_22]
MRNIYCSLVLFLLVLPSVVSTAKDSDIYGVSNAIALDDDIDTALDSEECELGPIINNGFEEPVIPGIAQIFFGEDTVPGWSTTATDDTIEIWAEGHEGISAKEGNQFAELNTHQPTAIYQSICIIPGATIQWSLWHRGRNGVDVMQVRIGADLGTAGVAQTISNGQTWNFHTGTYIVPDGQANTMFVFESVSTFGNEPSIGNFIDDIQISLIALPDCEGTPLPLTVGPASCEDTGSSYSITYNTAPGGTVLARDAASGNIIGDASVPGIITGIPHGTDVTVAANNARGCSSTVFTVDGLTTAQCTDPACTTPDLALGQPVCGTTGFSVIVSESTGAAITAPAGTTYADGVWTIPDTATFPLELVASNGTGCESAIGFLSAPDCSNGGCDNALVSAGTADCSAGDGTYAVGFLLPGTPGDVTLAISDTDGNPITGASVDTANNSITGVPIGTDLRITASSPSCGEGTVLDVASCGDCDGTPLPLTVGPATCGGSGNSYSITYSTAPGSTVTARGHVQDGALPA